MLPPFHSPSPSQTQTPFCRPKKEKGKKEKALPLPFMRAWYSPVLPRSPAGHSLTGDRSSRKHVRGSGSGPLSPAWEESQAHGGALGDLCRDRSGGILAVRPPTLPRRRRSPPPGDKGASRYEANNGKGGG